MECWGESLCPQALERVMAGRTSLIIAHRLSTVQAADFIAVLQDGHVVERGSHDQLMQNPAGQYYKMQQYQHAHATQASPSL